MISIRQILKKIFPKLNALEENPDVIIMRSTTTTSNNPFDPNAVSVYDDSITVPCIYSEQPEMITSSNNLVIQQTMYLYIKEEDAGTISMSDRFVFQNKRYRPVDIQNLFGLWKIKVIKE